MGYVVDMKVKEERSRYVEKVDVFKQMKVDKAIVLLDSKYSTKNHGFARLGSEFDAIADFLDDYIENKLRKPKKDKKEE